MIDKRTRNTNFFFIYLRFADSDFDFYVQLPRYNDFPGSNTVRDVIKLLAPTRKFTKFVPIPSARIPILKCVHIRTGYHCDLNFSDSLGVYNSPIVAHLLRFDERIHDMAIILKYWVKVHDLSGSCKLSNYALLWLLIFYLQSLKSPIIPAIKQFQRNVPPIYINDMNLAFNERYKNITKNRQRQSELLLGFFEFYSTFDFESQIICPLHGKAFPKENVVQKHPTEFARYIDVMDRHPDLTGLKLNKIICIQDPFDICQTIPGPLSKPHFQEFRWKISTAASIFKKTLEETGENGRLLLSIFNKNAFVEVKPEAVKANKSSFFLKVLPIESELVLIRKYLLKTKGPDTVIKAADIKALWAKKIIDYLIDMLTNVFCMSITPLEIETVNEVSETASKSPKVDGQSDVHTNDLYKIIEVIGTKDVFYGRKQQKILAPSFIRIEIDTSKKRLENNQMEINFKAKVNIAATPNSADFVTVDFEDLVRTKKNNFFKGFQALFSSSVRHFLKGYFLEFQTHNELGLNAEALPPNVQKKKGQPKRSSSVVKSDDGTPNHDATNDNDNTISNEQANSTEHPKENSEASTITSIE